MSDNKNILIQDRGWKEMQSLLEREMPQEKKKRRLLPWFIVGVFIIGTLAFLGVSENSNLSPVANSITTNETIDNTSNPTLSKAEIVENPTVINIEKSNDSFENEESEVKNSDIKTLKLIPKQPINGDKAEVKKPSENSLKNVEEKNIKPIDKHKEYQLSNQERSDLTIFESKGRNIPTIDSNQEILDSRPKHKQKETLSPVLKNLPPLDQPSEIRSLLPSVFELPFTIPFLNNDNKEIEKKDIKPIIIAQHKTSLSPYLFTAGNYQSSINGLGYEFGAGLDFKLNKSAIYFEVGYSKTNFDNGEIAVDFSPAGAVTEIKTTVFEDEGSLPEGTAALDLSVNNFSNITASLNELKFNLGVRKSISKRLNLNFGITYSRLLTVTNKSLTINSKVENGTNGFNAYNISASELYNKGAYTNFDVSPHIGLEYNFLPNAYLGLNYNYGLNNLIENTELEQLNSLAKNEAIYRRNIEAKIRYSF